MTRAGARRRRRRLARHARARRALFALIESRNGVLRPVDPDSVGGMRCLRYLSGAPSPTDAAAAALPACAPFANVETFTVYARSTLTFLLVIAAALAGYSPFRSGLATVPITVVMFVLSPRAAAIDADRAPLVHGDRTIICDLPHLDARCAGVGHWTTLLPQRCLRASPFDRRAAPRRYRRCVSATPASPRASIMRSRASPDTSIATVGAAIAGSGSNLDLHGYRTSMAITAALLVAGGATGLIGITNRRAK